MADEGERKLAAILSADVAGYSKLMGDDERATVRTLTDYRDVFREHIERHHGRVVDTPGDNLMAEFASPVEAVEAAAEIQRELARRNRQLAEHRRMDFRIGINLGDVLAKDGALFGDGVNIAARLEALAEVGGICISGTVFDQVKGKVAYELDFSGEHEVKNIFEPVRAYRVALEATATTSEKTPVGRSARNGMIAAAAVAVLAIAGVVAWRVTQTPPLEDTTVAQASASDPTLALPKGPSIAVLPFGNFSAETEQEYFSDGITEDIITRLSHFSDLRVIARNSTFGYKGQAVDIRTVGRELGADYVLEGSVRRSGQDLRVTAQLLDSADGTHLWAETFDTNLNTASLFEVQDAITEAVVSVIGGQHGVIARSRVAAIQTYQPKEIGSYECVLLAYEYNRQHAAESHARARDCLEAVIEAEPNYANALAALSMIYHDQYAFQLNITSDYDPLERALEVASRAVSLEPTNANAHRHLAMANFHRGDIVSFRKHAMRSIELNPNDPTTMGYLGIYLTWSGDMERGIPLVRKATTLNPELPLWFYQVFAFDHYMVGEYIEGLEVIEKNYGGSGYWDYIWKLFFLGHLGRQDEARAVYKQLIEVRPNFSVAEYSREAAYWNVPLDWVEALSEGLRASGVPEEPATN